MYQRTVNNICMVASHDYNMCEVIKAQYFYNEGTRLKQI